MSDPGTTRVPKPDAAPDGPIALRAGPLRMLFEQGDLRCIKLGQSEAIRRIYAAVRDHNWNTIPAVLRNVRIDTGRDFFNISYDAEHRQGEIAFVWRGEIAGESDGTIRFTFDGEARSTFWKNRIGFCVLHPIRECAGQPCEVEHPDGARKRAEFPLLVAAEQPVREIHDLRAISHWIDGVRVEVRFEGDLFEMEDQRNWIDASYKTFCTPLRLPYPVEIKTGARIQQAITVRLDGTAEVEEPLEPEPVTFTVDSEKAAPIPPVGLGICSGFEKYGPDTIEKLRKLGVSHLRVDLDLSTDWKRALHQAEWESKALQIPLEIALTIDPAGEFAEPAARIGCLGSIARIAVFAKGEKSTTAEVLARVRQELGGVAPIGVGTNADFYQLNQARPPLDGADFVIWSMNPQVHAFDDRSILETPEAVEAQLRSARIYFPGKPLVVSPVTLRPRFNPVATGPGPERRTEGLPPQVDERQRSRFGAFWAMRMLIELTLGRADSITMFETVGWRGLIERDGGSLHPSLFPSVSEQVFPVYSAIGQFLEFSGGEVIRCDSSDPRRISVVCFRKGKQMRLVAINLTDVPQRLEHSLLHGWIPPFDSISLTIPSTRLEHEP